MKGIPPTQVMHMPKTTTTTKPAKTDGWVSKDSLDRDLIEGDLLRLDPHRDLMVGRPVYGIASGGSGMRRSSMGNAIFVKHTSEKLEYTLSGEAATSDRWERYYPSIMVYTGPKMQKPERPVYVRKERPMVLKDEGVSTRHASDLLVREESGESMLVLADILLPKRTFCAVLHQGNTLLYERVEGTLDQYMRCVGLQCCHTCYRPVTRGEDSTEPGVGKMGGFSMLNEDVTCTVCMAEKKETRKKDD